MSAPAKLHAAGLEEVYECGGGFTAVSRHGTDGGDQFTE